MKFSKIRISGTWIAVPLLFVCALQSALLFAQDSGNSERAAIEIISIEHRDPLFVRSQLVSSLDPRGNIGLVDNKLIIASTAGNLEQLKALIADADVPARRLVVSVDFEYGDTSPETAAQQSSQALEGDVVGFTYDLSDVTPAEATSDAARTRPQVTISSSVQGDEVDAEVEILNVPGFSGHHPLTLMLGQWYVINPLSEVEAVPGLVSEFESAQAPPATTADEPAPVVSPIAVRVDVLP